MPFLRWSIKSLNLKRQKTRWAPLMKASLDRKKYPELGCLFYWTIYVYVYVIKCDSPLYQVSIRLLQLYGISLNLHIGKSTWLWKTWVQERDGVRSWRQTWRPKPNLLLRGNRCSCSWVRIKKYLFFPPSSTSAKPRHPPSKSWGSVRFVCRICSSTPESWHLLGANAPGPWAIQEKPPWPQT